MSFRGLPPQPPESPKTLPARTAQVLAEASAPGRGVQAAGGGSGWGDGLSVCWVRNAGHLSCLMAQEPSLPTHTQALKHRLKSCVKKANFSKLNPVL